VRGEGHEPDRRCGTVGTSGHAPVTSSLHTRAVLDPSGVDALTVCQLTAGELWAVLAPA